jgi:hypothetical protein
MASKDSDEQFKEVYFEGGFVASICKLGNHSWLMGSPYDICKKCKLHRWHAEDYKEGYYSYKNQLKKK